jgi:hypothetical protein
MKQQVERIREAVYIVVALLPAKHMPRIGMPFG